MLPGMNKESVVQEVLCKEMSIVGNVPTVSPPQGQHRESMRLDLANLLLLVICMHGCSVSKVLAENG